MKKYLNIAYLYAVAALAGGVFYREFTKFNKFTGVTTLGKVHTHLFVLGVIMFLIVALYSKEIDLEKNKKEKRFLFTYNIGVVLMATMLLVRGILEVLGVDLSSTIDTIISWCAGIGHALVAFGLILFLKISKKHFKEVES